MGHVKRKLVFQPSIFRCYVSFREHMSDRMFGSLEFPKSSMDPEAWASTDRWGRISTGLQGAWGHAAVGRLRGMSDSRAWLVEFVLGVRTFRVRLFLKPQKLIWSSPNGLEDDFRPQIKVLILRYFASFFGGNCFLLFVWVADKENTAVLCFTKATVQRLLVSVFFLACC